MFPTPNSPRSRPALPSSIGLLIPAATLLALLATGCASPGPPRPPSLNLPQPVTDLAAERVGDQVLLHWTTPARTTDGLPLKGNFTARICRNPVPAASSRLAAPASPCTPVLRLAVHTGPSTAADALTSPLTADPVTLLDYRVEIENAAGHTAGPSNPAFAAAGAAPPPVESLRATAVPTGAMLEWKSSPASGAPTSIELDRINSTLADARQKAAKAPSKSPAAPVQLAGQEPTQIHLRASPNPNPASSQQPATEPRGTIDQTARFGETYRYTAQRVRLLQLNGHALEVRSAISDFITLTLRDTFPPATPTGLAAIPNPALQPAQPASIDLSWDPNSEPDLAGYLVYRRAISGAADGTATRLSPIPIAGPAFRDLTATPGRRYAYTVTAIDTSNNESKPSREVQQTLPPP
jgi:hypothetical protein